MVRVVLKEATPAKNADVASPEKESEEEVDFTENDTDGFYGLSVLETRVVLVALPLLLILLVVQTIRGSGALFSSSGSQIKLTEGARLERLGDKLEVFSSLLSNKIDNQPKCADSLMGSHDKILSTLVEVKAKYARVAEKIAVLNKLATQTIVNSNYADVLQPIIYKVKEANEQADRVRIGSSKMLKSLQNAGGLDISIEGMNSAMDCPLPLDVDTVQSCPEIEPCITNCDCGATLHLPHTSDSRAYLLLGVVTAVYNICLLMLYVNRLRPS